MESKKRKPLADITNTFNLIPTSTLRELVAASSNSSLRSKSPISILKSVSSSTNQKLCSDLSNRSDASIGSSNVNSARNSRAVQFRNPLHAITSTSHLGSSRNKDAAHNRSDTTGKGKKEGKTDVLIANLAPVERRKDKGKGISVPRSSSPPKSEADNVPIFGPTPVEKRKDKGKGVAAPFSSSPTESEAGDALIFGPIPIEKRKDKGKGVAVPCSSSATESEADQALIFGRSPIEKKKDKGKGVAVPCSSSPTEREADQALIFGETPIEEKKDKGKGVAAPFSSTPSESEADDVLIFGQTPIERRKDKGKAIDVPFSSSLNESEADIQTSSPTPVEKREDKEKAQRWGDADIHTFSSTQFEKSKGKGKAVAASSSSSPHESEADVLVFSPTPVENRKDKGKAIAEPFSLSTQAVKDYQDEAFLYTPLARKVQQEKASLNAYSRSYGIAQKGEAVLNSSSSSMGTQEVIEKGTSTRFGHSNERGNNDNEGLDGPSGSLIIKQKDKMKEFALPPIKRTKEKEKHLNLFSSLCKKTRDTGKAIPQPPNTVEIEKHKESSNTVTIGRQTRRRKSESGKNDAGASSCPPLRRTRNLQDGLDEVGDVNSSNSWTHPHPKSRKKSRSRIEPISELPQDFIEQQKAYFKEVDEFVLDEEVASEDELD